MTNLVQDFVQRLLGRFGLRLSRLDIFPEPNMPFDVLELAVVRELSVKPADFYFIQVGANDGSLSDTFNPIIRKYGLRGCLVEPMPDVFHLLVENYSDQTQLDFRNTMIGDRDGTASIHRFMRNAPVPAEFYHGLAREDGDYINNRAKQHGLEKYTEEISCTVERFETMVSALPTRKISLLYIDTEGSDDKIVYQAFSAQVYPRIINYEWTEMSSQRRQALKLRLLEEGYRFIDVGADTVCLRLDQ